MAISKNITIRKSCKDDLTLLADRNAALTIFRNLLSNSVKFTQPGGTISLSAEQKGDRTKISICDNGIGMDPQKLQNIFSIKDRKSTRGTAKEKGIGLGMLLVREFLRLNKGSIEIESLPQQGTSIQLLFPAY